MDLIMGAAAGRRGGARYHPRVVVQTISDSHQRIHRITTDTPRRSDDSKSKPRRSPDPVPDSSPGPAILRVFLLNHKRRLGVDTWLQWDVAAFASRDRRSSSPTRSDDGRGWGEGVIAQARLVDVPRVVMISRALGRTDCPVFPMPKVGVNRAGEGEIGGDDAEEELEV